MTVIKGVCKTCDVEVYLPAPDVTVYQTGETLNYRFRCPDCGWITAKPSSLHVALLLLEAGCGFEQITRPAEVDEPHDGPPITETDYLDFKLDLWRTNPLAELEG